MLKSKNQVGTCFEHAPQSLLAQLKNHNDKLQDESECCKHPDKIIHEKSFVQGAHHWAFMVDFFPIPASTTPSSRELTHHLDTIRAAVRRKFLKHSKVIARHKPALL